MDANQKAARTSKQILTPIVFVCLVAVGFILFAFSVRANEIEIHGEIVAIKEYDPPIPGVMGELWLTKITVCETGPDQICDASDPRYKLFETPTSDIKFEYRKKDKVRAWFERFKTTFKGCLEKMEKQ